MLASRGPKADFGCVQDGCTSKACMLLEIGHLCLRHFVVLVDSADMVNVISNQDEFTRQVPTVRGLWNDAITEVVLEMFDLQKQEENVMRKDPLSILGMNAAINKKELKRKFGAHSLDQLSQTSSQTKRTYVKSIHHSNPPGGHEKPYFKLLSSHLSSDAEYLHREIDERNTRERETADGDPCRQCNSRWTFRSNLSSGFDITKSEVWGTKDTADMFTTTCKECNSVDTTTVR